MITPLHEQVAFQIIEEELAAPIERIFSKISSQTIAAASLGQVYRATLRSSGEEVAIKVIFLPKKIHFSLCQSSKQVNTE